MVSATTYTLVGVVNKFLTVLLNVLVWDKHSTPFGIVAVCICLLAGTMYQQAPKREEVRKEAESGTSITPEIRAESAKIDVESLAPLMRK
jgi:hypothetical protein